MATAEYRRRHPDKIKAAKKRYRARHPEVRAAETKRYRERHPDRKRASTQRYNTENPEKVRAHRAVSYAVKSGRLTKPDACEQCHTVGRVEGHHHLGYAEEHHLTVTWLCNRCHVKAEQEAA